MGGLYNLCGVISYDEEGIRYKKEGGVLCKDMGLLLLCRRHLQRREGDPDDCNDSLLHTSSSRQCRGV